MKKYNVGIIGYGWVSTAHIAAINACTNAVVTAVYSLRKLDPSALSNQWNVPIKVYSDLNELLADKSIDIVSVCGYPYQHKDHALAAAAAGKHLIIEKPLALSWQDCVEIITAVEKAGVKTCICFECRFSSQFLTTKAVIDEGLLGDIHYGEVDYYHGIGPWYSPFRWNIRKDAGGSSLLTAGCHAMDALLLCMGNDVEEVTSIDTKSKSKIFEPYEYPTSSVTILKFANGTIGKCAAIIDCLQPYYFHTHLCGSEGSLLDNKISSARYGTERNEWKTLDMKMLDSGDVSDHAYQKQFQSFFDALEDGNEMPLTSIHDAIKTHEVIFAADESAITGKSIKLK